MNRRLKIAGALCLAGLLALGACGRRGDLEPPPGSPPKAAKAAGCETQSGDNAQFQKPIDAAGPMNMSGNTNLMPDTSIPPC
ncbi:MAG: lipoprotein [Parvibaculum sp.]|jgi:hypothetical protein|uniref:LPS translocon maturation chaperone LptM n=1 Tax=Parvibaculum sp. TaxID=2024848 RepID=UPI0011BEAE93|nr:lipoprotein [Parvibaculum sp.]MDR3498042.1 lipoprotein [Parvibaculum sp.]